MYICFVVVMSFFTIFTTIIRGMEEQLENSWPVGKLECTSKVGKKNNDVPYAVSPPIAIPQNPRSFFCDNRKTEISYVGWYSQERLPESESNEELFICEKEKQNNHENTKAIQNIINSSSTNFSDIKNFVNENREADYTVQGSGKQTLLDTLMNFVVSYDEQVICDLARILLDKGINPYHKNLVAKSAYKKAKIFKKEQLILLFKRYSKNNNSNKAKQS